ncbi:DNA-binding MarR family transcriptional regulator [Rhodovulum bhavnagarense]|uniref:DNA-binding MarR family transcriptional regulator n=1 Tax=Rhodovulum bhavnagarense TaxID=992286 RepID=A0A4R2RPE7_9RHOB|nr:MarR family winged helix-turn-helix transcriptional regulator [Rhodovulum bhavnagarense]TCP61065.1 DNA-binding MarR family transcriptional regulator [Rhodovulum bhavnagarense]
MEKPFQKERLTFRLDILAKEAIDANDGIFKTHLGLSIREVRALRIINDRPGITFVDLVQLADIERSRTSRIIQSLIKQGLVRRENDDEDARKFRLHTTDAGARKRAEAGTLSEELEAILLGPLDPTDIGVLDDLLARLATWIRSDDYHARLKEFGDGITSAK